MFLTRYFIKQRIPLYAETFGTGERELDVAGEAPLQRGVLLRIIELVVRILGSSSSLVHDLGFVPVSARELGRWRGAQQPSRDGQLILVVNQMIVIT